MESFSRGKRIDSVWNDGLERTAVRRSAGNTQTLGWSLLAPLLLVALLLAVQCSTRADQHTGAKPLHWYLTLDDAIRLALRNNRNLLDARLGRNLDKLSLELAEDRYRPTASLGASVRAARVDDTESDVEAGTSLRIPTGGQITLRWSKPVDGGQDASGTYSLGFSQPLLRGRGTVDAAPVQVARLNEESRILAFRDTIASVVDSTIRAWRGLTRAHRELEISEAALERAQRQLEVNQALIRAGEMAEREILQNKADIANRELAVMQARNGLIRANFSLVDLLDLDSSTRIRPLASPAEERTVPGVDEAIAIALRNRPAYRRAVLSAEIAGIELGVAQNERRWDLSLNVDATRRGEERTDYAARLNLSVPLWDRAPRVSVAKARGDVERARRRIEELRQEVGIAVRQAVHDVEVGRRRIELARMARDLAQQKLDIEREKLRQGLSSSFRITQFEEDLVRAQSAEADAAVTHENALTTLDRIVGTTLQRWGIRVEEQDE